MMIGKCHKERRKNRIGIGETLLIQENYLGVILYEYQKNTSI
jgi:hypothetical protein